MNHVSLFSERVQRALRQTERGVVGLVDDLLELSRGQTLRFDFQDSHCHVRSSETDSAYSVSIGVPLPKSVFRAALARIAALCNERAPDSVTPYHGEGELDLMTNPPETFRVTFINTAWEQRLEVASLRTFADGVKDAHGLIR